MIEDLDSIKKDFGNHVDKLYDLCCDLDHNGDTINGFRVDGLSHFASNIRDIFESFLIDINDGNYDFR